MRTSTATLRPRAEQVVTIRPLIPGRVLSDAERETVAAHERAAFGRALPSRAADARRAAARAIVTADPRKVRDHDGDVWERQVNGCWTLIQDRNGRRYSASAGRLPLARLRENYGPLEHLA